MRTFERDGEVRLLAVPVSRMDVTEGVAADKIGVEDFGTNTGALTDCAGRLGVASVVDGDCGGMLVWLVRIGGDGWSFQGSGLSEMNEMRVHSAKRRGGIQTSYVARVVKGTSELTKVLPVLAVGCTVGKKISWSFDKTERTGG